MIAIQILHSYNNAFLFAHIKQMLLASNSGWLTKAPWYVFEIVHKLFFLITIILYCQYNKPRPNIMFGLFSLGWKLTYSRIPYSFILMPLGWTYCNQEQESWENYWTKW